jgi:hypothetical protein
MQRIIYLILFLSISLFGLSQRRLVPITKPDSLDVSAFHFHKPLSVYTSLVKSDTFHLSNGSIFQVYSLSVFNNTDSTICVLLSAFFSEESAKKEVYILEPVIDCNDTLKYYSLEHCEGWDNGYLPLPVKPQLVSPNTYLNTRFAIELFADKAKEFHVHYANVDLTYTALMKAYNNDTHNWQRSLNIRCKRVELPE